MVKTTPWFFLIFLQALKGNFQMPLMKLHNRKTTPGFFNKKMYKCGQMKINQMAFMLIGVTIFLALVGMFFLVLRTGMLKNTATEKMPRFVSVFRFIM